MQSKSKSANCVEARTYNVPNSTVFSEPWWNTAGNNPVSLGLMGASASDPPSAEQAVDGGSQSDDGSNEEDDDAPEISETTIPMHSGSYAQVDQNLQSIASTIPPKGDGSLTQPPQLEPVAHSMACAPNLYVDPYYGGMLTPFGQHMVPPHVLDLHHPRMPLPHEMAQEPVYVNAKQYHGILRRRESRAKAELEKKLIKVRKPYLHESRHQHALKRARASGGRFAKKSDADTSKGAGSGSEPLLSSAPDVAAWHKDRSLAEHQHSYSNGSGYGKQNSFQEPNYQAQSAQFYCVSGM